MLAALCMLICATASYGSGIPAIEELGTVWREPMPAEGDRLNARMSVLTWDEDAHGLLGQINRTRGQVTADWMPVKDLMIRAGYVVWEERPVFEGGTYEAAGALIGARIRLFNRLSLDGQFMQKDYSASVPADTETGFLRLSGSVKDVASVEAGWERRDAIHNFFNLLQKTQSDVWRIGIKSQVPSRLTAEMSAESGENNDFNEMWRIAGEAGYVLADVPGRFRAVVNGEARDTRSSTFYLIIGGDMLGITYPYWTPQDYLGWGAGIDWQSGLPDPGTSSKRVTGGLRLLVGDDSEANPYARLDANAQWAESAWWSVDFRGIIHQSRADTVLGAFLELGIKW
jgi:cellulose synthase operon protein C